MNILSIVKTHKVTSIICVALLIVIAITIPTLMSQHRNDQKNATTINKNVIAKQDQPDTQTDNSVTLTVPESTPPATQQEQTNTTPNAPSQPASTNPYGSDSMLGYAYDRRQQAGKVVGGWGMGNQWPTLARQAGAVVDKNPEAGATYTEGFQVYTVESFTDTDITITTYTDSPQTSTIPRERGSGGWFIH